MKYVITLSVFMLFSLASFAQEGAEIGGQLANQLATSSLWTKAHVLIRLKGADLDSLKVAFNSGNFNRHERRVALLRALHLAGANQRAQLRAWQSDGIAFEVEQQFWIANSLIVELPLRDVKRLARRPEVEALERVDALRIMGEKPMPKLSVQSRSVGGTEPGLEAINIRPLWNLGYTGRNQKILNFDTGIWPDHPSFENRFLGKRKPLDQAWKAFDRKQPGDKASSHGTHTNGTCVGLDPATNDTIGAAFNAYFMATDPIVSNAADIRTWGELMSGYEWALDPDGNIQSTDDMPDVINNSWGRVYDSLRDVPVCGGFVADVFQALELADIVSIHSAGNNGPDSVSIGMPAGATLSLVNNFAVGAVDGNNPNFPLAGFSSRGPGHCNDTGSLAIRPEVVAPGVNVRSAVKNANGTYGYANYQGTSMAGPHVAGAALLLREAFPQATSEELKLALYLTATDLGVTGEDNLYGNGMIDAFAAYQYLAQQYQPEPALSDTQDLAINELVLDTEGYTCSPVVLVKVVVNQLVIDSWQQISFDFGIEGGVQQTITLSNAPQSDTITLGTVTLNQVGFNELYATVNWQGVNQEHDFYNNTYFTRVNMQSSPSISNSWIEDFENRNMYRSAMFVENIDQQEGWDTTSTEGLPQSSHSARMRLRRYTPGIGQKDHFISPLIQIEQASLLSFDVAYQSLASVFRDSLVITLSTDCGESFDDTIYAKGPTALKTIEDPIAAGWVPNSPEHWRRDTVDLGQFDGTSALIRFTSINDNGDNLYIDNINVAPGPQGMSQLASKSNISIYPNPARTTLTIASNLPLHANLEVFNISGMSVLRQSIGGKRTFSIRVSDWQPGVYIVKVGSMSKRLIIQ